ncbi:MAG: DUF1800 domain-containing protein [Chloroherpetonaceae bacterium]|nr:DUF1800 domain-containing protein [Chthonomonadaceae bacterium]MDW8207017.1 DUF1800 domain-containing protein [Chloroherpetonaceae bacterium]
MEGARRRASVHRVGAVAGAGAVAAGLTGCAMVREQVRRVTGPLPAMFAPLPGDRRAVAEARLVLQRAGFGPRPGDIARVVAMGPRNYLEEQLADRVEEDPAVRWRVDGLDVLQWQSEAPDMLFSYPDGQLLTEIQQAMLLRAVYSRRQLREALCDFWTNHFNIYAIKKDGRVLIPMDAEQVIRPHAMGRFRDLLFRSAHSPAMLAYLDNEQNRKGIANENYARELLELHTVGVESGYTLEDIQQVARCFTGWTIREGFERGQFVFRPELHDSGEKFIPFLNLRIAPGGGKRDAEAILERLAVHPATARFLSRKLCRRFLGSEPAGIVERAARAYLRHDTDIRAMLRPILLDGLVAQEPVRPLIKRPLDYLVSALRALAADTDGGAGVQQHLQAMGQPLYQWPLPDGYPDRTAAWTGTLLPRWNFALALAANAIAGTRVDLQQALRALGARTDPDAVDALIQVTLNRDPEDGDVQLVRERVREHVKRARGSGLASSRVMAEVAGLLLASPVFQWRA